MALRASCEALKRQKPTSVGFSGIDGLQAFCPVVQQIAPVNVEKLYPRAPSSARQRPCFATAEAGFLPLGEAVPALRPAADLGDTRNPLTPPSLNALGRAGQAAGGPDRPASLDDQAATRQLLQGLRAERYRLLSSARTILVGAGKR